MSDSLTAFANLPNDYIVLDTETTGLPDNVGPPGIVSLGMTKVSNRVIGDSVEYKMRPYRDITLEAKSIHGFSNEEARSFPEIKSVWPEIVSFLADHLIVIHNASFDWPIIQFHIDHFELSPLEDRKVFCSQKAAIPFAKEEGISMSERGPSLDALTHFLRITSLRKDGMHGAKIDSKQTALVVERLRELSLDRQ